MKQKLKFALFAPVALLLGLVVIFEAGFGARRLVNSVFFSKRPEHKTRILLIGDSVMGGLENRSDLAARLSAEFSLRFPDKFDFRVPYQSPSAGITTHGILSIIDREMKSYRPHAVIMLLGKSDRPYLVPEAILSLLRLRFFRFLWIAFHDLKTKFVFFQQNDDKGWKLYAADKFAEAIPYFQDAIVSYDFANERQIRALHHCFLRTGRNKEALTYFRSIRNKTPHAELVDEFLVVQEAVAKGTLSETEVESRFHSKSRSRNSFRSDLWFFARANRPDLFYQKFIHMPVNLSDRFSKKTIQNYRSILESIHNAGAVAIILQYPLDHLEALKSDIGNDLNFPLYVNLRAYLENADKEVLMHAWDEDMEHLSSEGAAFLAKNIVNDIIGKIGVKND